jgi:hypothetical protein
MDFQELQEIEVKWEILVLWVYQDCQDHRDPRASPEIQDLLAWMDQLEDQDRPGLKASLENLEALGHQVDAVPKVTLDFMDVQVKKECRAPHK